MKAVAFNGSPRKGGNTEFLLKQVLRGIEAGGIETELIQIGGRSLHGCRGCCWCRESGEKRCVIDDDNFNNYLEKMRTADAVLLGSPTYFADITSEMKALIDRAGYVMRPDRELRRKVGAAVVAARRGGAIHAYDSMNHLFLVNEMIVVGSTYWNDGYGGPVGAVEANDEEGTKVARILGENIAWTLKRLNPPASPA
jgi:multimeric flavodoxin WrbA